MTEAKKVIHVDMASVGELCCDNVACNFVLPEPVAWSKAIIGYPCPKCGESMMTEQDFAATSNLLSLADAVNAAFGDLGSAEPSSQSVRVGIRIHGDKTTITTGD